MILVVADMVPKAVIEELTHPQAPTIVRAWLNGRPEWLEIREIRAPPDPQLAGLDAGEREAIQLAQEVPADLVLIDERRGVKLAQPRGIPVTGTLGVLLQAARRGFVDIDMALPRLQATDFRNTPQLLEHLRKSALGGFL
ncbi:MAG: DUF3368 domain-containing protein [Bryobacteraceae bacterium]